MECGLLEFIIVISVCGMIVVDHLASIKENATRGDKNDPRTNLVEQTAELKSQAVNADHAISKALKKMQATLEVMAAALLR